MNKISIFGHFGGNLEFLDGQTIKTKILKEQLSIEFGEENIICFDTYNAKKKPLRHLLKAVHYYMSSENIIILPAQNGLILFAFFFNIMSIFLKRKIYYVVIGGWLPELLEVNEKLLEKLKTFNYIYVETHSMVERLNILGLNNVKYLPNFKKLDILKLDEINNIEFKPFKVCTFSRVIKEKGIEDAIEAVVQLNQKYEHPIIRLDIYGQVDEKYEDEFKKVLESKPDYIKYMGFVPYDKVVDVLKNYYLLIFPTYYKGEGFAGTLIDSFASGVPVIASDWRYNSEIINDGINGKIYPTRDIFKLIEILNMLLNNEDLVVEMKYNCLIEAHKYLPINALQELYKDLKLHS